MFDIISTKVVVHQFLAHQFEVKGAFGLRFLRLSRWELFHLERYSEMRFFYSDAGKLRNVLVLFQGPNICNSLPNENVTQSETFPYFKTRALILYHWDEEAGWSKAIRLR